MEHGQDQACRLNWSYLAGYFDGDGTTEFAVLKFTLHIRLAFDENWRLHLVLIKRFLENEGITVGLVRKKESYNTWHVVVSNIRGVVGMAEELVEHCIKKREALAAVIGYHHNEITGDEFVKIMNAAVRRRERTGKLREAGPPFTHVEGRELSFLASVTTRRPRTDATSSTL